MSMQSLSCNQFGPRNEILKAKLLGPLTKHVQTDVQDDLPNPAPRERATPDLEC